MDSVGAISVFFEVLCVALIALNLFDFVVCQFFTGKEVNFFHSNLALWDSIFPFFHFTLVNQFIAQTVSDNESPLTGDLVVDTFSVPFVNKSRIDLF